MKCYALFFFWMSLIYFAIAQSNGTKPDTTKSKNVLLNSVEIKVEKDNAFGISRLNNIEGTTIYAGKKTEAIYLDDINANLAANNSRQIFAKIAGLNIFENDGSGSSIGIGGRGLNPNRISNFNTRQNGYDISADALGYPESYYTPPAPALERIEILRGAASLQFGTQFGGMINYKFKNPSQKKIALNTQQSIGSFGFFNTYNELSGTIKKISYFTFYNYKQYTGWRAYSKLNAHTGFVQIQYTINDNIKINGEFTHQNYLNQQPGGLTDKQFLENPKQSNRTRNWFKVNWNLYQVHADIKLGARTRLNAMVFGVYAGRDALGTLDRIDRKEDTTQNRNLLSDTYNNYATEIRVLQRYTFLKQQSHFLIGLRAYKGATERQQGDANNSSKASFNFLNPTQLENSAYQFPSTNLALFIENIFQVTKSWNITPGIRWEYIGTASKGYYRLLNKDLAGNILLDQKIIDNRNNARQFVLLGIGSQYKLNADIEFYANFSQNYRSINFNDMRIVNPNFQVDPNLKDENGFTSDGGLRGKIKKYCYFDVSLFLLKYKQRIGTVLKTDSATFQIIRYRTNVSDSRNLGIEAFGELDWLKLFRPNTSHQLSTFINLSYIDARYLSSQQNGYNNKKVEYVPDFIIRTGITYAYKSLSITLQYAYTSQQFSDASNALSTPSSIYGIIPNYSIADASAQYKYKAFTISAGINNVLNAVYFTRRAEGYPGPGIIPGDPMNSYLTLGLKL